MSPASDEGAQRELYDKIKKTFISINTSRKNNC